MVSNSNSLSTSRNTYGTKVTITCLPGFWFTRDVLTMTVSCDADGNWTGLSFLSCTGKTTPIRKSLKNRLTSVEIKQ